MPAQTPDTEALVCLFYDTVSSLGEFERVGLLENQRKTYIEQAFVGSIDEIDRIRAEHLQSLNQRVVERLEFFKQAVTMQQARLRNSAKASRAYLSNDSVPK